MQVDVGRVGHVDARPNVFEIDLAETDKAKAMATAKAMCDKLIANTVIENYRVEVLS